MAKSWEVYKTECESVAKEGITILGFVAPWNKCRTKLICNCEKHGKWITTSISNFKLGSSCPSCKVDKSRLNIDIMIDTLENLCYESGYKFLGIVGEYKNQCTKMKYECPEHGVKVASINGFKYGKRCWGCGRDKTKTSRLIEDNIHIEAFTKTGKFLEGVVFTRSSRKNKKGWLSYWNYTCPKCSHDEYVQAGVCSGIFEATKSNLERGVVPCRCSVKFNYTKDQWDYRLNKECLLRGYKFLGWASKPGGKGKFNYSCPLHGQQQMQPSNFLSGQRCPICAGHTQQECYINSIWDEDILRGIKFGISVNSDNRLKRQNTRNLFQMKQMKVYLFPDVSSCKKAERACLKRLQCGIVSSRELKDGYSETTSLSNLKSVEDIFKEFGGVLKL